MVTAMTPPPPPPRTTLDKVNSHLICVLCRGYYIDATTIVECLHTFCRSCIVKHLLAKSYCPVCEVMINSARPNIKLDKALQDIVYKLVPGLFEREMARRRAFYARRPELAAAATPEQRGEDTERIVFGPDDVISFSLEYGEPPDASSASSESGSDAGDALSSASRRYLRCPAVVNVSHLKKFVAVKFDVDASRFRVEIAYKRVPLPDHYTLMDVAYIFAWKRVDPMRFFYRIEDFARRRRFAERTPPPSSPPPSGDAEKSQFLNSFDLKPKGGSPPADGARRPPAIDEPESKRRRDDETAPATSTSTPTPAPAPKTPPPPAADEPKPSSPAKTDGDDSLRSLFNSCNINIPPSLSITLKEQDANSKPAGEPSGDRPEPSAADDKRDLEIIKLPDADASAERPEPPKTAEPVATSAKGPVPNLKPISEAKLPSFSKPQTFQQTFLQSLQQHKDKPKYPKARLVLPKSKPDEKPGETRPTPPPAPLPLPPRVPVATAFPKPPKSDSALDLSTPHINLTPKQKKDLEMMQSIESFVKRQTYGPRGATPQSLLRDSFKLGSGSAALRVPLATKPPPISTASPKRFADYFAPTHSRQTNARSPSDGGSKPTYAQPDERSPSSSPKLVIACPSPKSQSPERKQFASPRGHDGAGPPAAVSSPQITSSNPATETSDPKDVAKPRSVRPPMSKSSCGVRGPSPTLNSSHKPSNSSNNPANEIMHMSLQQAYLRQQLQSHFGLLSSGTATQWMNNPAARAHIENIVKNMAQNASSPYNNHNSKSK